MSIRQCLNETIGVVVDVSPRYRRATHLVIRCLHSGEKFSVRTNEEFFVGDEVSFKLYPASHDDVGFYCCDLRRKTE